MESFMEVGQAQIGAVAPKEKKATVEKTAVSTSIISNT
jgi:hypothetical protein